MAKVKCIKGISFGATGEVFEPGNTYEVSADIAKNYPANFKKMATKPTNKAKKTTENK